MCVNACVLTAVLMSGRIKKINCECTFLHVNSGDCISRKNRKTPEMNIRQMIVCTHLIASNSITFIFIWETHIPLHSAILFGEMLHRSSLLWIIDECQDQFCSSASSMFSRSWPIPTYSLLVGPPFQLYVGRLAASISSWRWVAFAQEDGFVADEIWVGSARSPFVTTFEYLTVIDFLQPFPSFELFPNISRDSNGDRDHH